MDPLPGDAWVSPYRERRRTPRELRFETRGLKLEKPVELRLQLQQRAPGNLRRHMGRALARVAVLVVADLTAFGLMREGLRVVRDAQALGGTIAATVSAVLPRGLLTGWQFAVALFVGLALMGTYGAGDPRRSARRLFLACALATALPLWMTIWTAGVELVALQFSLITTVAWAGIFAERAVMDRVVKRVWHGEQSAARTVFLGPAEECRAAAGGPAFAREGEYRYVGFIDVTLPPAPDALGHLVDFARVIHEANAETVVVCGHLSDGRFQDVVDAALAAGCEVLSVPRTLELAGVQPTLVWRRSQPLIELSRPTLQGRQLFLKRLLDLLGSAIGLALVWPLFLLIALAVRLESRGPALFGHRRLGLNGRPFMCLKFRSMHPDAEARLERDGPLHEEYVRNNYKLEEARDPRLTRVGRILRRTSLDELPQLLNVLRGEMSLVGPRPIVPEELDQYGHGAAIFLSLKPGMTGAWAVNGRSRVSYPARADIELEYVRKWSLARDLGILARTVPLVVLGRGAH